MPSYRIRVNGELVDNSFVTNSLCRETAERLVRDSEFFAATDGIELEETSPEYDLESGIINCFFHKCTFDIHEDGDEWKQSSL